MNNIWRRSLALFLAFVMVFGMIPAVFAEGEVTEVGTSADFIAAMANGGNIKLTGSFELTVRADAIQTENLGDGVDTAAEAFEAVQWGIEDEGPKA